MKIVFSAASVGIVLLLASPVALALEESLTSHPDPATVQFYIENEGEIEELRETIQNGDDSAERIAAFEALNLNFPDAAFSTAMDLVQDADEAVALLAVELISGSIIMSDHDMEGVELLPHLEYVMKQHMAGREALRGGVLDDRRKVRERAVTLLASLSDEKTFDAIQQGVETGLYTATEAVNLFALAKPEKGSAYIEPYLAGGEEGAQMAAVSYLGANPAYQDQIRAEIFQDPDDAPNLRAQAAKILSRYDSDFNNYALTVTVDPNVDAQLYAETVNGYLNNIQSKGDNIDPATARVLNKGVTDYLNFHEEGVLASQPEVGSNLKLLQDRLQNLDNPT